MQDANTCASLTTIFGSDSPLHTAQLVRTGSKGSCCRPTQRDVQRLFWHAGSGNSICCALHGFKTDSQTHRCSLPTAILTLIVSLYCPVWSALGEKYLTQHDTELAAALPVMSDMHTCMLKACCACSPHSITSSLAALHAAVAVQLQKETSPGHTLCHSRIITNTSSNTSAVKLVKITTPQATLLQYN